MVKVSCSLHAHAIPCPLCQGMQNQSVSKAAPVPTLPEDSEERKGIRSVRASWTTSRQRWLR